ncbi:MAG TPA: dual specificity protein phosphatase family protein [Thermoplasmata archaeon]|nr:dual specificity protein phosphatase family protein [Thermoplasmata archaeon]
MSAPAKRSPSKGTRSRPKGPSEIAPGVFVGTWNDALRFEGARFCVLDEAPEDMPAATHIPIYDERSGSALRPNLDRLAEEIGSARAAGRPVLVFCGHGIRRSPLGGAWYLHRSEQLPLEEAYARVRSVRPKVEIPRTWMDHAESLDEA